MPNDLVQQVLELSPNERLELIQVLWDSLPQDTEAVQLTPAQLAELERRERRLGRDGPTGDTWDVVRERLRSRLQ